MHKKITLLAFFLFGLHAFSQNFVKNFNSISGWARLGNTVLLAADDGIHGTELWRSDGSIGGTTLVKDINPGVGPGLSSLFAFNNNVYFAGTDGINSWQLWKSDGTAAGTVMVKNVGVLATGYGAQPTQFTACNNLLYYVASSDAITFSLWKTDGTAAGTVQITPNDQTSITGLSAVGNYLCFVKGGQLWVCDGTIAGTKQIPVDSYTLIEMLHNVNNQLVFITTDTYTFRHVNLYALNPAGGTPVLLQSFAAAIYGNNAIDNITAVGSNFFFSIRTTPLNGSASDALWVSDCTFAGTKLLVSYPWSQYAAYSNMDDFASYNNKLYFAGTTSGNLFTSDGTASGTAQVVGTPLAWSIPPVLSGGKLYFNGSGALSDFDGATVKSVFQQPSNPTSFIDGNGVLFFTVKNGNTSALWTDAPSGQMQVAMGYAALQSGGTSSVTSKPDSVVNNVVTITNTGTSALSFSEIGISGDSFYVNGAPSQTVPPGGQTTFNLLYSPLKDEQVNAVLSIKNSDASGASDFMYNFTGTASGASAKNIAPPAGGLQNEIVFNNGSPDFTLSNSNVAENTAVNSTIGTFNVNKGGTYQYQLVVGQGGADNSSFAIVNGALQSLTTFNFANKNTYAIRVQANNATDTLQKIFVIQVNNVQTSQAAACSSFFRELTYSINDAAYAGSRIVAVATGGTIIVSDDNGQTWKRINSGITNDFYHVQFTSSKTGYIVGTGTPVLKTEDGGNTWFPLAWPATAPTGLTNLSFVSDTLGYVIGSNQIFKTTDGGRTWKQQLAVGTGGSLYSIWFTDANNGYICGSSETLLHTSDGGNTWQSITLNVLGPSTSLSNIVFVSATTGYITSSAGDVLQTTDGGNTWARISTIQSDGGIDRLYFTSANNGVALVGFNSSNYYTTTDGGHTWAQQTVGNAGVLTAVAINSNATNYCVVGHAQGLGYTSPQGSVIYTGNGAGTWTQRCYFSADNYVAGNMFSNGTGYVFGVRNLKTTDGGTTWQPMNISVPYPYSVATGTFINTDTGFYASNYDIYKSTDGGTTWTVKNIDSTTSVETPLYFYNANLGFYANGQTIYRTTNGGETWSAVYSPSGLGIRAISIADASTVYAVGIGTPFYKSIDGGTTWTATNLSSNYIILSTYFLDSQTGFIGGVNGLLLKTTDGGNTWTQISTIMAYDIMNFQFTDHLHGFATCKYEEGQGASQIYETNDGGLTWNQIYQTWTGFTGFQLSGNQLFLPSASGSILLQNSTSLPPANAGYINGDTTVVAGVKTVYTTPAVWNTYYRWTATGAQSVEYHNNQVIVTWQSAGKYSLQVTPYNNCSGSQSRTIAVDVETMPDPQVTGPDTVANYAANVVYTTPATSNTLNWTATGNANLAVTSNQANVSWGKPGNGSVTVVETNAALDMQKSSVLNVLIQQGNVNLPDSNFIVSVTSASCIGSNNGSIGIKAQYPLNYTAAVTGPAGFSKSLSFNDSLTVAGLDTGVYNVCIGIAGNNVFQRCYSLHVTQPLPLSVYSVVNQDKHSVTLDLQGAGTYFIDLNGKTYQTSANQMSLPLNKGANQLKIYTDKPCQGVLQKVLNLNVISVYPVPLTDVLTIDLGGSPEPSAGVQITDAFGRVMYNKDLINNNGQLHVDVSNLMTGAYVLKVTLGGSSVVFKILK